MIDVRIEFANFYRNSVKIMSQASMSSILWLSTYKNLIILIMYETSSVRNSKILPELKNVPEQLKWIWNRRAIGEWLAYGSSSVASKIGLVCLWDIISLIKLSIKRPWVSVVTSTDTHIFFLLLSFEFSHNLLVANNDIFSTYRKFAIKDLIYLFSYLNSGISAAVKALQRSYATIANSLSCCRSCNCVDTNCYFSFQSPRCLKETFPEYVELQYIFFLHALLFRRGYTVALDRPSKRNISLRIYVEELLLSPSHSRFSLN